MFSIFVKYICPLQYSQKSENLNISFESKEIRKCCLGKERYAYMYVQYIEMEGGITGYVEFNEREKVVEEYVQKTQDGAETRL